jgi:DNA-binding IclR family transcriptional regulator
MFYGSTLWNYVFGIDGQTPTKAGASLKSLAKALSVMDLIFAAKGRDLSIAEISREMNLPKGTSHRILSSLVQFKYVRQDPLTKKYGLGARFLDIGSPFEKRQTLRAFIDPMLRRLSSKCMETVSVAILVKDEIEYIERYESEMILRVDIHVGTRFPAHCSSTGKVLLSALSEEELDLLFNHRKRLRKCTDNSIGSLPALKGALAKVRDEGVARDYEECLVGVHCIASPILGRGGEVTAAVSISGPRERLTVEKLDELEPLLREATEEISHELRG